MKSGTTHDTAMSYMAKSQQGVRRGEGNKNTNATSKRVASPAAPTTPIKGMDRGGV